MILKSVRMKNIRSFTDGECSLSSGITLLSGDIGCGKSTILTSIEFALFGLLRGETQGAGLLRHGEMIGSVTLQFTIKETQYEIFRSLKRTKQTIVQDKCYIKINNGGQEDISPTELKTKVLDLLGYPIQSTSKQILLLFRYTVYTTQEKMKDILEEQPEVRLHTLRVVFDIEKYQRIKENTKVLVSDLREKVSYLEGSLQPLDELTQKINILSESIKVKRNETREYEYKLGKKTNQFNSYKKKVEVLQEAVVAIKIKKEKQVQVREQLQNNITKIDICAKNIQVFKKEMETLQKKIELLPHKELTFDENLLQQLLIEKEKIVSAIAIHLEKINLIEKLKKDKNEALLKVEELQSQNKDLLEELVRIETDESKLQTYTHNMKIELQSKNDLELQLQDLQIKLKSISQSNIDSHASCPLCHQTLDAKHKLNVSRDLQSQINGLEKKIQTILNNTSLVIENEKKLIQFMNRKQSISKKQTEIMSEIKSLQRIIQTEVETPKINREALLGQKKEIEEKIKILEESRKSVEIHNTKVRERVHLLEKELLISNQLKQLRNDVEEQLQQKIKLESQIEEIDESIVTQYEQEKKVFVQIESELSQLRDTYNTSKLQLEQLTKEFETLTKNKTNLEILKSQKIKISKRMVWLKELFLPVIDMIEKKMFQSVYSQFSILFSRWFSILLDDSSLQVRLDTSFSPIIDQQGFEVSPSYLSGGERTSVALAYRLALTSVINNFHTSIATKNMIILDEPTEGFSHEQLDKVRDVLQLLNMSQIILVSHEQKMESYADKIITLQKVNTESQILT